MVDNVRRIIVQRSSFLSKLSRCLPSTFQPRLYSKMLHYVGLVPMQHSLATCAGRSGGSFHLSGDMGSHSIGNSAECRKIMKTLKTFEQYGHAVTAGLIISLPGIFFVPAIPAKPVTHKANLCPSECIFFFKLLLARPSNDRPCSAFNRGHILLSVFLFFFIPSIIDVAALSSN